VPVAVQRDLVTGGGDLCREGGVALHLFADEEERRCGARCAQRLEYGRRSLGMWTVVECQRDAARVWQPERNAESVRERWEDRSGREQQRPHGVIVAGMQLALGFAAAAGAAACYDTAYALQALEARSAPARHALRIALLHHLARRPLWLGAIALSVAGWPLQLLALSLAPLTLVEPTLALGLLLLLALGVTLLGEHVGRREVLGVLLIIAGVAGIAAASPGRSTHHAGAATLAPTLAVLGAVALTPYLFRRTRGAGLVVSAGAGDAWAAFAAKLVVDELSHGRWPAALGLAVAAGLAVGVGFISELTALQSYPATRVGPVVLVMQIVIPVLLAPLVGGERWGTGGPILVVALAAVAFGAALLASSRAVGELEDERGRRGKRGEREILRLPPGERTLERGGEPGA